MKNLNLEWLICREPVHIGGADSSSRGNNNPIYRLPDRTPVIPGSSLRGALREAAEHHDNDNITAQVNSWFGSQYRPLEEGETSEGDSNQGSQTSPGAIALSWAWPVWWPVHVLGYGHWWVSCPAWLNRVQQFRGDPALNFNSNNVYVTDANLAQQNKLYLRWLQLTDLAHDTQTLPAPQEVINNSRIVVPDDAINLIVDMGLVRQPRVSLLDEPNQDGTLVKNLFAVEGLPPGAVFLFTWTTRDVGTLNTEHWPTFLHDEHYLGGLWSVGYGRIEILDGPKSSQ